MVRASPTLGFLPRGTNLASHSDLQIWLSPLEWHSYISTIASIVAKRGLRPCKAYKTISHTTGEKITMNKVAVNTLGVALARGNPRRG